MKYSDAQREALLEAWEVEKELAQLEDRDASMARVYSSLAVGRRFAESTIALYEAGLSVCPKYGQGGRPRLLDDLDIEHLQDIVRSGRCATALEFCEVLALEAGVRVSERRMQEILAKELKCKIVQAREETLDKWSQESYLRLLEYIDDVKNINRIRMRFYDQTNFSRKELTYKKRRKLPDMEAAPAIKTPTNTGSAYSVFGRVH
eukprot:scaffold943_cov214-Pinguiococcus_pyrenoidosus.AAC.1